MSLLLAAVLALSLAGCSEEQSEPEQTSAQTEQQQTEETEETQQASETEPTEETEQPEEQPAEEPAADEEQSTEEPVAGEEQSAEESTETETEQSTEGTAEAESSEAAAQSSLLVAYFSYAENAALPDDVDASASASIQPWNGALTGNTGVVADMIAQATGADLFSIRTVEQYPDTYDATLDQGQQEQSDGARPELATHLENLDSYDTIFLGFPNWWGDMPMAVYTFLDEVDLSGKTVIPFVTSGGSGFSNTISTIQQMEPQATVQEGLSIGASSATGAQQQVESWLSELGLA
ncbi:MAG TPA: flavodoxin [Candidatus Negativibacillus faecipullorum]|nr:flavodoxin [Candidatus Negativibacillus faecipullorum]